MIAAFFDPRVFNVLIFGLSVAATLRWASAGNWGDALYWFFAPGITATVTWGYIR